MTVIFTDTNSDTTIRPRPGLTARLAWHMNRPQRHRLLHGYPLAAAMPYLNKDERPRAERGEPPFVPAKRRQEQPLLIGVLPHPFCNPKIRGCGYCTFPHESFSAAKSAAVVCGVIAEIDQRLKRQPDLRGQAVAGLYFGGGTANLTPVEPFRRLASKLSDQFDLSQAEVSLEGVPKRFVDGELLDVMRMEMDARHMRISMGIQTFDEAMLGRMGRLGFGRPDTFAAAAAAAHVRDMTVSGDLMINLPGQSLQAMRQDVFRAMEMGLDQICLYHLVAFPGMGTVWSQETELLSQLPCNEEAAENWEALRESLIGSGYRQTSLTNFERSDLANDPRRYQYEAMSYQSSECQVLGFGPGGISYSGADNAPTLKTLNPESSVEYLAAVQRDSVVWNRYFAYEPQDREILYLTRRLAALSVDVREFSSTFGAGAFDSYEGVFSLFQQQGLLRRTKNGLQLTSRGMFYSDSMAGMLVEQRRRRRLLIEENNDNSLGHM